ncbi:MULTISPECIES: hypothetical protein [Nocardiopsidaceae]|uniref:Uncharacterized protein n=2 Tax=Nocardiopsidaceae TaxID=83676 RepID=A0ABY6YUG8_9ACTN|nr:hypothetical protein [Streptomonospora nanhaiensis]MEE2046252.1 hypothetical protein [Nocardiopsis tropica]WAE76047.1 hypothetical protein OUQ99_13625 [Streptomonospora nanhaiensis]
MYLREHDLVKKVLSLGLPEHDFVIAGSGPLLAHDLRWEVGDIDVVARGAAWERALTLGEPEDAPFGDGVRRVLLFDDRVEILNGWFPDIWTVDELIDGAEVIDGLRFAALDNVRVWKTLLGRSKDHLDVKLINEYLESVAH